MTACSWMATHGVVLDDYPIMLVSAQRCGRREEDRVTGLVSGKHACDGQLFGVALPRMLIATVIAAVVTRAVILEISMDTRSVLSAHYNEMEPRREDGRSPGRHASFVGTVLYIMVLTTASRRDEGVQREIGLEPDHDLRCCRSRILLTARGNAQSFR